MSSQELKTVSVLKRDHQRTARLLQRLLLTADDHKSTRDRLFAELRRELLLHAEMEDDVFYRALRAHHDIAELAAQSRRDHDAIVQLLTDMSELATDSTRWSGYLKRLSEQVEHHVREEEDILLPRVRAAFPPSVLESLGERMERHRTELRDRW